MTLTNPLRPYSRAAIPALAITLLLGNPARAAELLTGTVELADGDTARFVLDGESRDQVIGGELRLGETAYRITHLSRLGLIGATREPSETDSGKAEYAVLSSSFSTLTATGQPWVAANRYLHCDQPYNTFLAIYRDVDDATLAELGAVPYPILAEGEVAPVNAVVYCFYSQPPERG